MLRITQNLMNIKITEHYHIKHIWLLSWWYTHCPSSYIDPVVVKLFNDTRRIFFYTYKCYIMLYISYWIFILCKSNKLYLLTEIKYYYRQYLYLKFFVFTTLMLVDYQAPIGTEMIFEMVCLVWTRRTSGVLNFKPGAFC